MQQLLYFGVSDSVGSHVCHGAAVDQVPLQVALLDERTIAEVAVEGPLSAVHAHVRLDAEQLSVCSSAGVALQELIRSSRVFVASKYFLVASVHALAVVTGGLDRLAVSRVGVLLLSFLRRVVVCVLREGLDIFGIGRCLGLVGQRP